jgi:putative aldouronate transport system substrate-binding protein
MRKKSALMFAVVMAGLFIAGCGGGQTTASQTSSAPAEGGPVSLTVIAPLFSDPPAANSPYWEEWMRITNSKLDIEWVPSGDYSAKMNLKLASGDLPEMLVIENMNPAVINAIKGGAFWELDEFLGDTSKYPNLRANVTPGGFRFTTYDGKIWGIPRSRSLIGNGLKIRKDWLDDLGLPVPTTLDEYVDVMRKVVAADPVGSGTIGYITIGSPSNGWYDNLKFCFGYSEAQYNAEGGYLPPFLADNYFDFLTFAQRLYSEGLLPNEFVALRNQSGMDLFTTGLGFSYCRDMWWDYQWEQSMRQKDPKAEIINVVLEGPKGNNISLTTGTNGGIYMNAKVPRNKVIRTMDYFEASATPEATDLGFYGKEGVHHTVENGTRKLNEFGVSEVTATSIVLGALDYNTDSLKWGKVDSASALREYNLAKRAACENYDEIGNVNIFGSLKSETWASEWPKYKEEFESLETRLVVGQISMDQFKQYVSKLRDDPAMKKAYLELAQSYENFK